MSKQTPTEDVFDRLAGVRGPDVSTDAEAGENTVRSGEPDSEITSDDGEDREPAGDDQAHPTPRGRVGVVLIGAIVAAALGLSAFLGWRLLQVDQTAAAGQAALDAAKS